MEKITRKQTVNFLFSTIKIQDMTESVTLPVWNQSTEVGLYHHDM